MVSKYQRNCQQQTWYSKVMEQAVDAMKKDHMAWQTAAKRFKVLRNTMKCHVLNKNHHTIHNRKCVGHYFTVFNEEQELKLVNHLFHMEVHYFRVTVADLHSLAYQLAVQNNIPNNFTPKN